jgi:predicted neuraminidase
MLVRSNTGFLLESVSRDAGATWPTAQPSDIKHPSARFFIRRLASGKLLLVKHHNTDVRERLTALLSDDGKTWSGGLVLDERGRISYPDGVQAEDGRVFIIYDRNRTTDRQILMAVFTEADVMAGEPDERTRLRIPISEGR